MNIGSVVKNIREMSEVGVDILLGRYPRFVYGMGLEQGQVPIFVFHSVEPDSFERMMEFLAVNRYVTLDSEDLYFYHNNPRKALPEKSIMLTFDDGMKSVWTYAFPLLKKYGFKATTFLIPGRIPEQGEIDLNLEDVWDSRVALSDIKIKTANGYEALANWKEIENMHNSGVIDFQSHTNGHELIFTSPEIVGFLSPQALERYHEFEFPKECISASGDESNSPQYGRPLYTTAPRMSDKRRFIDSRDLSEACIDYVMSQGKKFFDRPEWEADLRGYVEEYKNKHPEDEKYESRDDQYNAIYTDLHSSITEIEDRLHGKKVHSLCFPWGIGGQISKDAACTVGFKALYWGKCAGKLIYRRDDNPMEISRIGEDFFYLLPGKGRESLAGLVSKKIMRRLEKGSPFYGH